MASRVLVIFLTLSLALTVVEAGKKNKKKGADGGSGGCKESIVKTFRACLANGLQSSIEGCKAGAAEGGMNGKQLKKCKSAEKQLVKCGHKCSEASEKAAQLIRKCGHEERNFGGADLFNKIYLSIEDCVEECIRTESCKSITFIKSTKKCYLKSKFGGSAGPTVQAGYISTNMECDRSEVDLSCARKDLAFSGNDIRNLKSDGMEDCARLCSDTENCKSITLRESDNQCWLKSSRGGSTGPYAAAGHRSLNLGCNNDGARIDMKCLREGVNFYGADLRNLAVFNAEECAQHCSDTQACQSFMYRDSDHLCFLKSKQGGDYPKILAGYSSMNMKCDDTKVTNMDCLRRGFNFHGNHFGVQLTVKDQEECVRYCRDTQDCKSITFRESDNGCFLRNKRGGDKGPYSLAGHDSMNIECDNSKVKNLDCLREGIWFGSADLSNLIVENEEECVRHCRDTEACKALGYRDSDKRCYLKTRRGGTAPSVAGGHRSMNLDCDNSEVKNLKCFREAYNFPGAEMGNLVVADEEECVRRCRDTEGCKAITYRAADTKCWLKNRRGGGNGPRADARFKSLNMECDNSPVTMKCLRRGVNFAGAEIGNLVVSDESECVRHCRDTENCKSVTFRESDHRCYLRSQHGGSYLQALPGHNSLNMECQNGSLKELKCPVEDEQFPGHDLRNAVVRDVETCLQWCRDTAGCAAASFNQVDNRCYMKTRAFEWWMFKDKYKSFNIQC